MTVGLLPMAFLKVWTSRVGGDGPRVAPRNRGGARRTIMTATLN